MSVASLRFPCTGHVQHQGFGAYLEKELGAPRRNLKAFASELGARFGASRLTLTNSGSSANLTAALALAAKVGRGKHAIAAGFTFPTTLSSLLTAGFSVTVVDTAEDSFCIDPEAVRRALTPETRVLAVTHFLGFPAPLDALEEIARQHDLLILQDGCETMELNLGGQPAHRRGALTTWSFYHPHHLSSFGGGAVISSDEPTQRLVESVSHWGRACTCHVEGLPCAAPPGGDHQFWYVREGHNLELSELNACFGRFQLASFDAQEQRRKQHYATLFQALQGLATVQLHAAPAESGSPFVFPITVRSGDARPLCARLLARGVEVRSLMGGAITRQPAYRHLPDDGLARCVALSLASFFVGVHQTLPSEDVAAVATILREECAR